MSATTTSASETGSKTSAQPIVIVVREYPVPPWFSAGDDDDD
jgi:hypothetical protein